MPPPAPASRGWTRAALLLVVGSVIAQSVFQSWATALVMVCAAYFLLAVILPRRSNWALALAALAALVLFTPPTGTLWYLERGWAVLVAGWFVAVTLRWPETPFTSRGLGAVAGAGAVVGLIFLQRPGDWRVLEAFVTRRLEVLRASFEEGLQAMALEPSTVTFMTTVLERALVIQRAIFPALLVLGSLSALAVAWWLHRRVAARQGDGLAPLAEFRFPDGLVWLVVAGLALLLIGPEGTAARIGWNTLVVGGALYALRGAAVVAFVLGGLSVLNAVLIGLSLLALPAFVLSFALVIGLGDTWLDLRGRARAVRDGGGDSTL